MAFILALFVRTFVFENFKIPSGSMEDNLLIGDHLVVNKFVFAGNADSILHRVFPYRSPERGDVVVFSGLFGSVSGGDADLNGDGIVNFGDFVIFPDYFFGVPGPSGIAP